VLDEETRLFLQSLSPTRLCHTLTAPCMLLSSADDGVRLFPFGFFSLPIWILRFLTSVCADSTACVQVVCAAEGAQLANALRAGGRRTTSLVGSGVDPWSRRRRHRQMHLGALLRFHKEHLKKEW